MEDCTLMISITPFLDKLNQSTYFLYYPVRIFRCSIASIIGGVILNPTYPWPGFLMMSLAYTISEITGPLFALILEKGKDFPLIPLFGQAVRLILANLIAREIIYLTLQYSLSFPEILILNGVFLTALWVYKIGATLLYALAGQAKYDPFSNTHPLSLNSLLGL